MPRQSPDKTGKILTYWWNQGSNFGDVMNPLLLERLTGYRIEWSNQADYPVFAAAGSIIDTFHTKPGWTAWGSGVMSPESGIPDDLDIRAVRGPRTKTHLEHCGYTAVPATYGDPGLLLPLAFPQERTPPSYDLGIIPHYAFRLNPSMHSYRVESLVKRAFGGKLKVAIISPKLPVDAFIEKINSCKSIAANSLHGLITSIAYGIPCQWIHFGHDPFEGTITSEFIGTDFKYVDFLESIGRCDEKPIIVNRPSDFQQVLEALRDPLTCAFDPLPLLESFPYKPKHWDSVIENATRHFGDLAHR